MNALVLSVSVIATSMRLITSLTLENGSDVPRTVQSHLRYGQEDAIIQSRRRHLSDNYYNDAESYVDTNDNIYIDDDDRYDQNGSGSDSTLSTIVNEAETEMYTIYENPPSEWSLTEWKIFSAIVAVSLTILICCAAMCIRCCCGSDKSEKYEEPYKSFEEYSTCSSDDSTVGPARRNRRQMQNRPTRKQSKSEKVLSFDNEDKSPAYDKIMRLRSG